MAIKLDFSNVEDSDFTPLPAGKYKAFVFAMKQKLSGPQSKNPGSPYLEFTFQVPEENNRRVWQNYSLQPNALWNLKMFLQAVGYPAEKLVGAFELDEKDLLGKAVILTLGIEDWNGRQQNTVKVVEPVLTDVDSAPADAAPRKKAKF